MTPHWRPWLWLCCLLIVTIIDTDYNNIIDKIASRLPQRIRLWTKDVPSQDVSPSMVDDAGVAEEDIQLDDTADCSEDGTCDTGDLYTDGHKNADGNEQDGDVVQGECVDTHESCEKWASTGECEANPAFMKNNCKKSCFVCGSIEINMGVEQNINPKEADAIHKCLEDAEEYLRKVGKDPTQRRLLEICKNKHEDCATWAVRGECESNPAYMKLNCAPVCHTCDQLSLSARCPIDLDKMPNAWKPGDLNAFFTNLTMLEEYAQYTPKVLSAPSYLPGDTKETADYKVDGPWIVTLDNVLTDEEAERLIELGNIEGYKQSFAGGKMRPDGTYEPGFSRTRTSSNAWCQHKCYQDPVALRVIERISHITKIPETNSEYLQLLKYEVGEFYKSHHDYLEHGQSRQTGVRLLTVFLYLNDVEEGGGTEFPDYGITVMPKRGRALIWPSVLDEAPDEQDGRTEHQALPVIKGVKYGANAWIHQRDFKTPYMNGCN